MSAFRSMDRRCGCIFLSLAAAALFIVSVLFDSWDCLGHAFGPGCITNTKVLITGILLIGAGAMATLGAILFAVVLLWDNYGAFVAAPCFLLLAANLGLAGILYYHLKTYPASPLIGIIAMSMIWTVIFMAVIDYIAGTFWNSDILINEK